MKLLNRIDDSINFYINLKVKAGHCLISFSFTYFFINLVLAIITRIFFHFNYSFDNYNRE